MTRKQALCIAIEAIDNEEVKEKLNEIIGEMPIVNWSEKAIFDALDQFVLENERMPKVSDLKKAGLPKHTVIKHKFGITAKEFLNKYYDIDEPKHLIKNFKIQYEKIKPASGKMYDKLRDKNSPCWSYVAKKNGLTKWSDLIKTVKINDKKRYNVTTVNPIMEQLTSLHKL